MDNAFDKAWGFTESTQDFIKEQIEKIDGWTSTAIVAASSTIDSLAGISFTPPDSGLEAPPIDLTFDGGFELEEIIPENFGKISPWVDPVRPDTGGIPTMSPVDIPLFESSISGLVIPEPPAPGNIATPGNPPPNPGFSFPAAPIINIPPSPVLVDINIPEFVAPELPVFDPTYPEFEGKDINTAISWAEPKYTEVIIQDAIEQIRIFLAGGSGINPAVEDGMVGRARDREDRLSEQQEEQAIDEFANRGYDLAPGALVKRVDHIREENLLKKLGLNREVLLKVYDVEIENLRFAVQQGIQAENLYKELHLAAAERLFEIQRLSVQWQVDIYNLQVTLFNAQMQAVAIEAQVYKVQVDAALVEIEYYKAQIEGELAKTEVNKNLVDVYEAQIRAQTAIVANYTAQVNAVSVEADVYSTEIDAFKASVDAYAAQVNAERAKFEAYESRIKGELGKASIMESEARAYAAHVDGISAGVQAEATGVQAAVAELSANIDLYEADIRGNIGLYQSQLAQIQANVSGYTSGTQRYIANTGAQEALAKVEIAAWDGANRTSIAYYEAQVAKFKVDLEALVQQAEVALAALKASGDLSSTIAGGGMAAMHVGASMAGNSATNSGASLGESYGYNSTSNCGTNTNVTYSVDSPEAAAPSFPCNPFILT